MAVTSAGDRLAGLLAGLVTGLVFDFFLTVPFQQFTIASAADVQTTLLLLGVGVAVAKIAHRGRKHQGMASKTLGYLEGVQASAKVVADGSSSPSALIRALSAQIGQLMRLARCRFDYGTGLDYPRLECDGSLRWRNQI